MPEVTVANVPAREAIENFRAKLKITSRRSDEYMGAIHAKAFTVAGATKIDLVNDFHGAVASALENGTTITEFRKQFDDIVAKHGWSYKGSRGWRTRTIFDTNLRSAHAAGRWQQIQRTKKARPWLVYYTVDDSRVRDEHRKWHLVALPVDDPWWDTHYPPNGWGCRCWIITASDAQLKRWGIEPAKAPPINTTERMNTATGEYYGEVPEGIDTGWDYNVGKAWLGPDIALGKRLISMSDAQLAGALPLIGRQIDELNTSWKVWLKEREGQPPRGYAHTVGFLPAPVLSVLKSRDIVPSNAAIVIFDRDTNHGRGDHKSKLARITKEEFQNLPVELDAHSAVLIHGDELVFVMKEHADGRTSRAVVAVNFTKKGVQYNSVRSLGRVPIANLRKKDYELIWGNL